MNTHQQPQQPEQLPQPYLAPPCYPLFIAASNGACTVQGEDGQYQLLDHRHTMFDGPPMMDGEGYTWVSGVPTRGRRWMTPARARAERFARWRSTPEYAAFIARDLERQASERERLIADYVAKLAADRASKATFDRERSELAAKAQRERSAESLRAEVVLAIGRMERDLPPFESGRSLGPDVAPIATHPDCEKLLTMAREFMPPHGPGLMKRAIAYVADRVGDHVQISAGADGIGVRFPTALTRGWKGRN
jgi:hypothetical protein